MTDSPLRSALGERLSQGIASATELANALGVSQPTLSRSLRELESGGQVLRLGGRTRGARYARKRAVAGIGSEWPLYRVDPAGEVRELGVLHSLARDGYALAGAFVRGEQVWNGLPSFLQDARPAGFLGRMVPALYPELQLPARVIDWTDDHALTFLTQRGADNPGNLVLGMSALDRALGGEGPLRVPLEDRATQYPAFAAASLRGHPPGSSAHGEHPKFTAVRVGGGYTHVIVKFSPPIQTPVGRRWADLLHAEHLAHEHLASHGVPATRSQILEFEDRVFLECERFDRVGSRGRVGTATLLAIDAARYGKLDHWSGAAQRLMQDGLLSSVDAQRLRLCDAFGALIGNTDRHFGNITLFDPLEGGFTLAPIYDMLPMLYAPQDDQIVARVFSTTPSAAIWLDVYPAALAMAREYWERLSTISEISAEFRRTAERCADLLRRPDQR